MDANQRWDVGEAISWVTSLAPFRPLWIEEPTSPDDILGHATISKVRGHIYSLTLCVCVCVCVLWRPGPRNVSITQELPYAKVRSKPNKAFIH